MIGDENMNKNHKLKNHFQGRGKLSYKHWWVVAIYFLVPIVLMWGTNGIVFPKVLGFMSEVRGDGWSIENSEYAVDNVLFPFAKSSVLVISFIMSYLLLKVFQKKLLKKKIHFEGAKKCLKYFETVLVLLAIIVAVYGKIDCFDYSSYGYRTDVIRDAVREEKVLYVPLEYFPSTYSIGLDVPGENILYSMVLHMSQMVYHVSDNLEIIVAIAGAVIIPLKDYAEAIEKLK